MSWNALGRGNYVFATDIYAMYPPPHRPYLLIAQRQLCTGCDEELDRLKGVLANLPDILQAVGKVPRVSDSAPRACSVLCLQLLVLCCVYNIIVRCHTLPTRNTYRFDVADT